MSAKGLQTDKLRREQCCRALRRLLDVQEHDRRSLFMQPNLVNKPVRNWPKWQLDFLRRLAKDGYLKLGRDGKVDTYQVVDVVALKSLLDDQAQGRLDKFIWGTNSLSFGELATLFSGDQKQDASDEKSVTPNESLVATPSTIESSDADFIKLVTVWRSKYGASPTSTIQLREIASELNILERERTGENALRYFGAYLSQKKRRGGFDKLLVYESTQKGKQPWSLNPSVAILPTSETTAADKLVEVAPDSSITLEVVEEHDPVSAFIIETCAEGKDQSVTVDALYRAYVSWCRTTKQKAFSKNKVGTIIRKLGYQQHNGVARTWLGFGLKVVTSLTAALPAKPVVIDSPVSGNKTNLEESLVGIQQVQQGVLGLLDTLVETVVDLRNNGIAPILKQGAVLDQVMSDVSYLRKRFEFQRGAGTISSKLAPSLSVPCSFCGKPRSETKLLVGRQSSTGTFGDVFICDECIEQCTSLVNEAPKMVPQNGHSKESVEVKLAKSINELQWSIRATNYLQKWNVRSIGELVQKTEADMLRGNNTRNTRKTIREIKTLLEPLGLSLGMKIEPSELDGQAGSSMTLPETSSTNGGRNEQ